MNIEEILEILPHRQPFLLVDRVLESSLALQGQNRVGCKVKALKNVSYNEAFFAGHFPDKPIMPGVLIIESLAQAGALSCFRKGDPKMDVAIARISEVKIRRPVTPGDQLILMAEVIKDRGSMVVVKCRAEVSGELVTDFEVLATVTPKTS